MTFLTVVGPDMGPILRSVEHTWAAVVQGDGTPIVQLDRDHWIRPVEAAEDLTIRLESRDASLAPWVAELYIDDVDTVRVYDGARGALASTVDLWVRLRTGQFDALDFLLGTSPVIERWRLLHQRPGVWPAQMHSSWGITSPRVPDDARTAYDLWKLLGGGVADRPVLTNKVTVTKGAS